MDGFKIPPKNGTTSGPDQRLMSEIARADAARHAPPADDMTPQTFLGSGFGAGINDGGLGNPFTKRSAGTN